MYLRYAWPYLPDGKTLAKYLAQQAWYPVFLAEDDLKEDYERSTK